jgi:hypothetical protein
MKRKHTHLLALLFLAAIAGFSACEKEASDGPKEETSVIKDDALSSELFDDVFNETDQVVHNKLGSQKGRTADTCKTVTMELIDDTTRQITIDFGQGNCTDMQGRTKKGKIMVTTTGRYRHKGFTRKIAFEDYYVNDFKIEGTKTVINVGYNEQQQLSYSVTLENGRITTPSGKEITKSYERTRTWTKGVESPLWIWDDVYKVTGTAEGTNRNGVNYTRTIGDPLEVATTCRFIKSGTLEFARENKATILVDYGDGECDALATITVDDMTTEIQLNQ